ncbi:hypothetical protein CRENBAI_026055 [Crenichthys baileyi]|uniref:Uncharacterized protein n=1 Tax=Crenichthys baileyi TaxID=28760 RepID=A0AAV9RHH5_9TELE
MQSTEANCVPESSQQRPCLYNAEWSSFSRPEGGTTGPYHRVYSSNVQFSRPARTSRPTSTSTEVSCKLTLCSLWMLSSTSSPRTTLP